MKVLEKRALARCGAAEYFRAEVIRSPEAKGRMPDWVAKLTYGPDPAVEVYERLKQRGLITWNNGWILTGTGWQELNKCKPKEKK